MSKSVEEKVENNDLESNMSEMENNVKIFWKLLYIKLENENNPNYVDE